MLDIGTQKKPKQ